MGELEMPFARLMIVWFVAFIAIGAVFTMLPLALIRVFGVSTGLPATTYAFAAAASLAVYPLVTRLSKRRGAGIALQAGFALRAIAIALLAISFLWGPGGMPGGMLDGIPVAVPLALAGFVVLVLAWPLLGVSGTALAAQLAPGEKGEALGLFNASTALASAIGAFLGGWAMDVVGYGTVCVVAAVVVALAVLCSGGENKHSASVG
jgi:MFS transporter, DHA1 family, tetracycline resistance protein